MANITLSIPDDVRERMKMYPGIKWSEIATEAIFKHLDKLIDSETHSMSRYTKIIECTGINLEEISLAEAEKYYMRMRGLERERQSMT